MAGVVARRSKRLISWDSGAGVPCGAGVGAQLGGEGRGLEGLGVWIPFHVRKPRQAPWYALRSGGKTLWLFCHIPPFSIAPHVLKGTAPMTGAGLHCWSSKGN